MPSSDRRPGLVPALLKQWRSARGLSQLDLALAADVSARHISFLETGRSLPSPEMVLRLGATLGVPLDQVDAMLTAAGHDPVFDDDGGGAVPTAVQGALDLLKSHHEPFPLIAIDRTYDVVDLNRGALALLSAVLGSPDPDRPTVGRMNLARLTFDPLGAQPHIANFGAVGRELLWRIQREVLAAPGDTGLGALLGELLDMPTVPDDWREADLSIPSEPALALHVRTPALDLRFLTTVTAFQAPQNVATEQLRVEHWFPLDDTTADACHRIAAQHADEAPCDAGRSTSARSSDGAIRRHGR